VTDANKIPQLADLIAQQSEQLRLDTSWET